MDIGPISPQTPGVRTNIRTIITWLTLHNRYVRPIENVRPSYYNTRMRFLTLRHISYRSNFGQHAGPYSCGYAIQEDEDTYDAFLRVKARMRFLGAYEPTEDFPEKTSDYFYGFLDWDQFYSYWVHDDEAMALWTDAGYVVFEYDLPPDRILCGDTQAVATLGRFRPRTCYTL